MRHIELVDAWAETAPGREVPMIHVAMLLDGVPWLSVVPADILENRAAEYDMGPADTDALLDLVLSEAHLDMDPDHPDFLLNAPSRAHARDAHLARCRSHVTVTQSEVKRVNALGQVEARKRGEPSPRQKVRDLAVIDPEVLAVKVELVETVRAGRRDAHARRVRLRGGRTLATEQGEVSIPTAEQRAARVRALMKGRRR